MTRILIISEYIAPVRAIASVRWTKISKYLKRGHDVEITILTNEKTYSGGKGPKRYEKDHLLEKDMCFFDDYRTFKTGALHGRLYDMKIWLKKRMKGGSSQSSLASSNVGSTGTESFARPTLRHYANSFIQTAGTNETVRDGFRYYREMNKHFDVVVSTYGPVWPSLLAGKIKKEDPSVVWIADFRDVYAGNPYETKYEFEKHKGFVSEKLAGASAITKTTEGFELFEGPDQKIYTLTNGYDPDEKKPPLKPEKFDLVYTGTFYPRETDLSVVFRAVRELLDEKLIAPEDLRIAYAGGHGEEFKRQAGTIGVEDFVRDYGFIQRDEALLLQQKAAILLQSYTYSVTYRSLWSGKMYEYMMSAKPIVFAVNGDTPSEQCPLMPKLGGIGVEECRLEETYPGMKAYILAKYNEWKATGDVSISRDEEYVRSFAYDRITDSFWNIIEQEMTE